MTEFTFIVITYNQEQYVVEHLESIKKIIEAYGSKMHIDLVIADDKSKDRTVEVAQKWINDNRKLFRDVHVLNREENLGTIRNIKSAIEATKTEQFKFLAGDDKYNGENIFELQKKDTMVITPVVPFGEPKKEDVEVLKIFYKLILKHNNRKQLARILDYACIIPAPGVFLDSNFYRDEGLWTMLEQFRLIEDYPTWHYLLNSKLKINVEAVTKPYIYYRMSSGISTGNQGSAFLEEDKRLKKVLRVKTCRCPKYINIYKYIYAFKKFMAKNFDSSEVQEIDRIYKY